MGYDEADWKSWKGEDCLNRRLPEEPVDANGFRDRGNRYSRHGNYERAIQDYNQAIELEPEFADTYYDRGCSFYEIGMYDEAVADLSQAIELYPQGGEVLLTAFHCVPFHGPNGLGRGGPGDV